MRNVNIWNYLLAAGSTLTFSFTPALLSSQPVESITEAIFSPFDLATQNSQELSKVISLEARDSTVLWLINRIGQLAGVKTTFYGGDDDLNKRISVSLKNVSAKVALQEVLKNTSLQLRPMSSGNSIVISGRGASDVPNKTEEQNKKGSISGIVTDSASKAGIPGIAVTLGSTNIRTVTNAEGKFFLREVSVGEYNITFRAIGYTGSSRTAKVIADKETQFKVSLSASTNTLSEVVTTAVGSQRRIEVANDIVKINAEQVAQRAPVRSVLDLIEAAQVPGVLVTRAGGDPGAASRIRIRGIGSISQSNDPVLIIDGVWADASTSQPSRLDDIDPASIETIEIIRGPSAATLFGQDASNGVIVITTKKGRAGPTRWNLSYNRDWGQTYGRIPLTYVGVGSNVRSPGVRRCRVQDVLAFHCSQDSVITLDPNNSLLSKEGTETNNRYTVQMDGGAANMTYSVTASTGNTIGVRRTAPVDLIRYRILNYKPDAAFITPSKLDRNNITAGFVLNPHNKVTMGITVTGSQSKLTDNMLENRWSNLWPSSSTVSSTFRDLVTDTLFDPNRGGASTIIAMEEGTKTTSGIISSSIQYRPNNSSIVSANFGAEKTSRNTSGFSYYTECVIAKTCSILPGTREELSEDMSVYTVRLNASTNLNLGSFSRFLDIRPSIGGDFKKNDQYKISIVSINLPIGERSISSGTPRNPLSTTSENAIAGWFLNSTIGIFRRIYFDVGIRQDIGSAITSSKNAQYPKIGGSWLISDESFWRENRIVNSLRFRSAIGHAAVQPELSDIYGKFLYGTEYIEGKFVDVARLSTTGNSVLRPERSVELELGFDMDMLDDRLNLIGTYARKENRNTLVVRNLPPSFGVSPDVNMRGSRKENIARVRNSNFELSAIARAIETQNLQLVLNYALTFSDNKVLRLGDGIAPFSAEDSNRVVAGYPLASGWSRRVLGYSDDNDDGMLSIDEIVLSDSLVYIGWSQPRYRASYGITLTLNNQITFDSRFAYQGRYAQRYRPGAQYGNEDVNAPYQEQASYHVSTINAVRPVSDLRWNSASVTYHLPQTIIRYIGGRNLSVSMKGSNLGLWTNYMGRDPAINSGALIGDHFGDNGTTTPRPRLYVLDFKLGF